MAPARRPRREAQVALPPTPIPPAHVMGPIQPIVSTDHPATPGDASAPPSLPTTVVITPIVELSPPEEKKVIAHAQKEIIRLLFTQSGVPLPAERDNMMAVAMHVAMQSVIGHAVVAQPKAVTKQMMQTMSKLH
jgi:hypothetical protein